MRFLAIALMCGAMVCFTGLDTSAKWLSASLPIAQIVWTRYVGASLIALAGSRVLARPMTLRSKRPWLQLLRSALLFGSTSANLLAVHQLQLSETATISFLAPIFVALLAGPLLGEKVSGERLVIIAIGFLGVLIATRPGTTAFQPIVLIAIAGVVCYSGYVLATRKLAGADSAETTLAWTQIAGIVCLHSGIALDLAATCDGGLVDTPGRFGGVRSRWSRAIDRGASICSGADPNPVYVHTAHLDDHFWHCGLWTVARSRYPRWSGPGRGLRRLSGDQRAEGTIRCDGRNR